MGSTQTSGSTGGAEDVPAEVAREQELARNGGLNAMSQYNQKVIERKEQELRDLVMANYSRIREVERELSQLQLQVKLTAGPKRQALELMRKKIEVQNEVVASVRQRYQAAKQAYLALEAELQREEEEKDKLCNELNTLIQQSTNLQLSKLEELRQHLEQLNHGMAPGPTPAAAQPTPAQPAAYSTGTSLSAQQPAPVGDGEALGRAAAQATVSAPAAEGPAGSMLAPPAAGQHGELGSAQQHEQRQRPVAATDAAAAAAAAAARSRHVAVGSRPKVGQGAPPQSRVTLGVGPENEAATKSGSQSAARSAAAAGQGAFRGFDT